MLEANRADMFDPYSRTNTVAKWLTCTIESSIFASLTSMLRSSKSMARLCILDADDWSFMVSDIIVALWVAALADSSVAFSDCERRDSRSL